VDSTIFEAEALPGKKTGGKLIAGDIRYRHTWIFPLKILWEQMMAWLEGRICSNSICRKSENSEESTEGKNFGSAAK